jgi:hypothetical protein
MAALTPLPCSLCRNESEPVIRIEKADGSDFTACAICLATALDTLTGFHFVSQYDQWKAVRDWHAKQREESGRGSRIPKGTRYVRSA